MSSESDDDAAFESADEGEHLDSELTTHEDKHPSVGGKADISSNDNTYNKECKPSPKQSENGSNERIDEDNIDGDNENTIPDVRELSITKDEDVAEIVSNSSKQTDRGDLADTSDLVEPQVGGDINRPRSDVKPSDIVTSEAKTCVDHNEPHSSAQDPEESGLKTVDHETQRSDSKPNECEAECSESRQIENRKVTRRTTTPDRTSGEKRAEKEQNVLDKLVQAAEKPKSNAEDTSSTSWSSGWSGWGTSLLSTATESLTTFTSNVEQGFSTLLETVDTSLGAPPPDELLTEQVNSVKEPLSQEDLKQQELEQASENESAGAFIGNKLGDIKNAVESTVSGGIDVLEAIGKKTYEVITDGDPAWRRKRSLVRRAAGGNTPNLSQVLREARDDAERVGRQGREDEDRGQSDPGQHYGYLFDEYQGLVHLEALEMLSRQCEGRVEMMCDGRGGGAAAAARDSDQVLSLLARHYELPDIQELDEEETDEADHEFIQLTQRIQDAVNILNMDKINMVHTKSRSWLKMCKLEQDRGEVKDAKDIHGQSMASLAELTAKSIEYFHKCGELLLLLQDTDAGAGGGDGDGELSRLQDVATNWARLTVLLCEELQYMAVKYAACLSTAADDSSDPDSVTPLITNLYLEASNSVTYVQDGLHLTRPIVQDAYLQLTACGHTSGNTGGHTSD